MVSFSKYYRSPALGLTICIVFLSLAFCKENKNQLKEKQILGDKVVITELPVWKNLHHSKKERPLEILSPMQRVTVLDSIQNGKSRYFHLKLTSGEDGYAPSKYFAEDILFVIRDGETAFDGPSMASAIHGKLTAGSYCFLKEFSRNWAKADCYGIADPATGSSESWSQIWIDQTSLSFSRDMSLKDDVFALEDSIQLYKKGKTQESRKVLEDCVNRDSPLANVARVRLETMFPEPESCFFPPCSSESEM